MANLTQLRIAAREIFQETLTAVDAWDSVRREMRVQGSRLISRNFSIDISQRNVYSVAIGKAASSMASATESTLGDRFTAGIISGLAQSQQSTADSRWQFFEGGHPLPAEASLLAGKAASDLLERANQERALVIFLVSGGGSAMIEWPIGEDITLADMRMANKTLVKSGASIGEINAVRRAFSAIKGSRLAFRAPNCDQVTLIVSDVPAGQEWNVASGPTLPPPQDAPKAFDVVETYQLRPKLPDSILRAIDVERETRPAENSTNLREHLVLLSNDDALEAAASAALRRGFTSDIARDISDESIESGCEKLLQRLAGLSASAGGTISSDLCLISGGEFSCPVKGDGLGGRNLETALRLAIAGANRPDFVALCAGTDGIDGNSPAAGAIVDNTTIDRAQKAGLDPQDFLDRSDAYSFFIAIGDAITTGPTGTNVRDLRILLQSNERKQIDT
jgi:hydroxypyruvate reductase